MSDHVARAALSRMTGREIAVAPHYTTLLSDLRALSTANRDFEERAFNERKADLCATYGLSPVEQRKPFAFSSGVAIIPVHGMLINRFGYSWGYVTGYNFLRSQVSAAGQDPDVMAIIFDAHSNGGEVAGCFEFASEIKPLAANKPTLTVIDSNCYSACYAIAAGTDRIVATPSGGAGSIGVVGMHVSMEKALDDAGYKITFIFAGDHKVDGNPFQDLPDSVRADWQKSIDKSYGVFVSHVAKGRKMDEKAVRATEARTYRADDALSVGLIDAVASPAEAVQAFLGELTGSKPQPRKKEDAMSDATKPDAATNGTPDVKQQNDAAVQAERARIKGITSCDEAKGREQLANHLAFNTTMNLDEAKAMLAAAPVQAAKTEQPTNPLAAAMASTSNPNVGADTGAADSQEPTGASAILAAAQRAGVRSYEVPAKH